FDHETATEHFKYLIEDGQRFYLAPRPYDRLRQHLIVTRQKIVINTNYEEAYARFGLKTLPGTKMTKSGVFVPLIIGDKVNSYISLQNMEIENAFSDSDIRLLETLANSMSVALENARLFDETTRLLKETEQRTAELAVINSVQEGLARELDMKAIYDLVGNKIRDVFDAQAVIIATFDHETGTEKFNYLIEKGERYYPEPRRYDKLRYQLIMSKQKILINSNVEGAFSEFGLNVVKGTDMPKSILYVPLIVGNKVTSYVSLQNVDKENAFSDSDVRLLETLANSMSVALENARLFDETNRLLKETEQGKAELAVINSVQEGLVREMDIQGIYNLVGDRVQKLFTAQVVIIATFDHEKRLENFNYYFEKGETSYPDPRHFDKVRQHLIETGQNILINADVLKAVAEFGLRVVPGTEMPKSLLFMPLKVGDKVTGYVSLQNIDKENAFSFSDVRLLSTLANSMSVALENARLFDETNRLLKETEQRTAELAVINSVQEGLARELDIHGIYKLVGDRLCNLFPDTQTLVIRTFNYETNQEYFEYFIEKGEDIKVDPRPFMWANKQLIQTKQSLLIHENYIETAKKYGGTGVTKGQPPKSAVFVPMLVGEVVKGSVSLQNVDRENAFTESDLRLLTTLTNSMSVALENARLFDETNRLLKETEQRTAELSVINSVQGGLAKEIEMQGIYELVGEKIREIFNAQVFDIVTYDKNTDLLKDWYSYEKGDRTLVGTWKPFGFRKIVIETGQLLLINEDLENKAIEFSSSVIHGEQPKSAVFVPLISRNEVKGMISLQNLDKEHAFSDSDVSLLTTLANSMSVALESARRFDETNRLLKETEQRNAELAVINSVQESLVAKMDMQGIYELVGEKIREIFDAQVIDIVIYDRNANQIEDRYSYEKGDRTLVGPREPKGFRKHVIQSRQLLLHNENVEQAMRDFDNEILIGEMPKSQVYVPMIAGGEVKGIISLQNLDHEHAFSDSDVSLITTLANSMSVALESARLFDETTRLLKETEQRNAELAVINSVQESLVAKMDMQGIYELVGEKIREIFDAQVIDIVTYDPNANLIEDRYAYEKGDRTMLGPREIKGFRKHVIQTKQLLLHNENVEQAMRDFDNEILIGEKPKSQVYVPMIAGSEIKGIISLQNLDHEHAFSDSDVNLLTTLANSMSVALESARLFDETTRLLKETEQRTAELAVINSVQDGLAKELNIQGIYDLVGNKIRDLFDAQVVVIRTFDIDSGNEYLRYAIEKSQRFYSEPRPLMWANKNLIQSKEALLINENYDETAKKFGGTGVATKGQAPKSAVFVPMLVGEAVKGSVSLQNVDRENAFSESDLRLLTTLTNSMSVALENARLFDETTRLLKETEQRTAELSVINSVQEGLARELDIQGIYELVGEKMREIFNAQVFDIVTYDKTNGLIEDRYTYEKGDRTLLGPRPLKGFRKHVFETAKPLVINKDVDQLRSKYDQAVIIGEGAKSLVLVPMITGGEVTGVISLQNLDQEYAFPESDVNLLTTLANSMSVALENARLFDETTRLLKETEQRTAELAVINSVQEGLAKELNIQGIYDLIGNKIRDLFDAQAVIIATFNHEAVTESFNYMIEKGERFYPGPRPLGKLRLHLIQSRKKVVINKQEEGYAWFGTEVVPGTEPIKSGVFVPLMIGDKITSYVSLQNIDRENAFSESHIRLLETLANSMSVALENARLFDETNRLLKETEQRTAELGIINSVQEGLASKLDIQAVYDLVGDKIRDVFDTQGISIAYYDRQKNFITHPYYLFKGKRIEQVGFELGKGLTSHIINTGQPLLINENASERFKELGAVFATSETEDTTKSWLGVPLISGGLVNGTIRLENYEREFAYSESDVSLLQTLANSMSVALENARLFDETNRLLKETEQRTAELAVINSVQEGLAKELDIQGIYNLIGDRLCELFPDTQTLVIRTFDHETGLEHFQYAIEKGERLSVDSRPFIWASQHLIRDKKPIHINENYS
ncbi:MAG: GAF domain-containing protein, partial [Chitinophagaceae bacterium]